MTFNINLIDKKNLKKTVFAGVVSSSPFRGAPWVTLNRPGRNGAHVK